jgi:hypothetical protein
MRSRQEPGARPGTLTHVFQGRDSRRQAWRCRSPDGGPRARFEGAQTGRAGGAEAGVGQARNADSQRRRTRA